MLENSSLRFANLTFGVPGATVQLAGTYDLRSEMMDFTGRAAHRRQPGRHDVGLQVDPGAHGAAVLPPPGRRLDVPDPDPGPRNKPSFGLDIKRAFLPG